MNVFADFHARLATILARFMDEGRLPQGLDLARATVEPPRDPSHGDLATNAAMVFAKEAKAAPNGFANPRAFAEAVVAELNKDADVASAEVAGPGFINMRLRPEIFDRVIASALSEPQVFGRGARSPGKVNVEYVSANPTGPMHVGHGRGAVFGDALASVLAYAGRDVTREYYINDAGAQVDVLARSAFHRYREALGEEVGEVGEGLYPGDYLKPVGAALAAKYGPALKQMPDAEWLALVRPFAIDAMMDLIREDLAALNIRHEVFFSERSLTVKQGNTDAVSRAVEELRAKGLIYEGRLPPPKGQLPDDWEDREQTLFRSTQFGDDVDRALLKSDGSYTYFASDIAYHRDKIARGYVDLIDVWGADHGGYVKRMSAAVKALSGGAAALDVKLCQMVKLLRDGEPVKMSKRSGDFVTLREVVDEVGVDAVRFMMLMRKNDAPLDFDLAKVIEKTKDNPVFYVQYAHARAASTMRKAVETFPDADFSAQSLAKADFSLLTDEGERGLIAAVANFPRLIEQAAAAHEPHRLAFYLNDLAAMMHSHYTRGRERPDLRFINEDHRNLSVARIALVGSLKNVFAAGLGILGVSAPEQM
jgi:arginyl-tRNA synthetase